MVTVNVVVLAGTVAADPVAAPDAVRRRGDRAPAVRPGGGQTAPPPPGRGLARDGRQAIAEGITKGDDVLVHGQLVRRFYRSGAGARSLTEVVATGIKKLEPQEA